MECEETAWPRPADRCPYRGPLPRDFDACPTFRAAVFAVADSTEKPLGTAITCAHLKIGEEDPHHFYPRCGIGTPADRLALVLRPLELAVEQPEDLPAVAS